jgi:hypothetical protein
MKCVKNITKVVDRLGMDKDREPCAASNPARGRDPLAVANAAARNDPPPIGLGHCDDVGFLEF